jgi:putative hydrolase of the HAD superfamily
LQPLPTGVEPQLDPLPGVRGVVFDVYGTLFASGCGDISLAATGEPPPAFAPALAAVGVQLQATEQAAREVLHATIRRHQDDLRGESPFPEVDILDVWHDALPAMLAAGLVDRVPESLDWQQLALDYELRVNPVWPMPHMIDCCMAIKREGLALGIVSNAQFFTRELFMGLCQYRLDELGFDDSLCFWSYEHLRAKPDTWLYERAAEELALRDIAPHQVLYIGNDMRNDIAPAARTGFRTALFAGDRRSLRLREGDPTVGSVRPDRVVTDLAQIIGMLRLASA